MAGELENEKEIESLGLEDVCLLESFRVLEFMLFSAEVSLLGEEVLWHSFSCMISAPIW